MDKQDKIKAYSAWASVSFFWGTTYLAIGIGVKTLPPALFAGIRFLLAGLVFIAFLRLRGYRLPQRQDWVTLSIVGIALLVFGNATVVWAQQWVPSGLAALIVATVPFFMVGIEAMLPGGERIDLRKGLGILIGFTGLTLLLWPDLKGSMDHAYLKGVLVLFLAPLAWGAGSVYSKHRKIQTPALMAAACQMLIAGIILCIVGLLIGEGSRFVPTPAGLGAIVYLLIFGSIVGYGSYIYVLDKLPTAIVSMYAYINPVIAVVLGWLILDEKLNWLVGISTAVILTGVVLVKTGRTKKRNTKEVDVRADDFSRMNRQEVRNRLGLLSNDGS
ncbi:EamA family transporter [bacterium]|nr:EamA family transporter [bacterium]